MEIKSNSGNVFKNTYKKEGDKTPDYKGKVNVNGKEMELAMWISEGKNGKYFSLKFQETYVKPEVTDNFETKSINEDADSLPF